MKSYLGSLLVAALIFAMGVGVSAQPALKDVFKDDFLIGAAMSGTQISNAAAREVQLVVQQFNSITPENALKWESVHAEPGRYDFAAADRFVAFGEKHQMFIVGHTLVWHSQTPRWVFQGEGSNVITRELLLERMRDHIMTVVGRYKGRVKGWDVVNEALDEEGRLRQTPWMRIIGEDYLVKAFQFAHEADPDAELYYNDYALEKAPKRRGAIALVKRLKAAGIRLDGVGIQEHVNLIWPTTAQLDETLAVFGQLGVKTMVTELDVNVLPDRIPNGSAEVSLRQGDSPALNPYTNGLPTDVQQALADRYAQLFSAYLKHRSTLSRVTFWGVTDGQSWLNDWPIRGRTSYPLLFNRDCLPKPALDAVIQTKMSGPSTVNREK